jgi:methylthioribose-1-phosphate isomerase
LRIVLDGEVLNILAVSMANSVVHVIDQRLLPFKLRIRRLATWQATVQAIKDMVTRGAGSVGVAGAFAVAQAALQTKAATARELRDRLATTVKTIVQARPTAVTLQTAAKCCLAAAEETEDVGELRQQVKTAATAVLSRDMAASRAIGQAGQLLLQKRCRILTHCNTGALGFQDHGTALAVVRFAHAAAKQPHVFVSETRPWLQGSRLTTWELRQEGIPHDLAVDSACAQLLQQNRVDVVIVGADRIAANGDVANKIGTYDKAVLAHEHGIPFYVAAPTNTFDLSTKNGQEIEIEERGTQEVLTVTGCLRNGRIDTVLVAPDGTSVLNPVFDVTPAKHVTGFITERGVLTDPSPGKIERLVASKPGNS